MAGRGQRGGGGGDQSAREPALGGTLPWSRPALRRFLYARLRDGSQPVRRPRTCRGQRSAQRLRPRHPQRKRNNPIRRHPRHPVIGIFTGSRHRRIQTRPKKPRQEPATPATSSSPRRKRSQSLPQRLQAASSHRRWGRVRSFCKSPPSRARATRSPWPTRIQQKGFPSFVVTPTTDNFYRVQVGPYADEKSADASKRALEQAGFKSIIKR